MRVNQQSLKRLAITLLPGLFLALIIFAVFFTTLVIKDRTFYVFQDNIDQFFAWYQKLAYSLHHGFLPIWDANVSSGHSFVGELQAGVFYPVNLIWVWLFGSAHGISVFWLELIVVFHFWLASLGMYLVARVVGLGRIASFVAGLAYAFGGGVAVRSISQTAIFFGLCYIPWVFYWFQRYLQTHKKRNLLWSGIALGLIILAGHIDPWYFSCLIVALAIIFRSVHPSFEPWLKTTIKQFAALIAVVAISLIIALPQIALSAQYLPKAVRFAGDPQPTAYGKKISNSTFTRSYNFNPQDVLSLVDPVEYQVADGNPLYIGLVGLATVLVTVVFFRRQLREHPVWKSQGLFILGSSGVCFVLMLGYWTFIPSALRLVVPDFTEVRQLARYVVIVQLCLALTLGICIEVLSTNFMKLFHSKKRKLAGLVGGVLIFGFLTINSIYDYMLSRKSGVVDKHFVYQNIILALTVGAILFIRKHIDYILLAAIILSSIVAPVWFMPRISEFESTYPPNYYKLTPAISYLEKYYGKDRVLIEDNALPVNIGDVYNIQTMGGYGATLLTNYYNFTNEPDPLSQPGLHLDLLNIRFIVAKTTHQPGLKRVFYDKVRHISIYERKDYLPRAYFANQLNACNTHTSGCTPIDITKYNDTTIDLHYTAPKPETLVLSEVYYVGWHATVDGHAAEITPFSPTPTKLFRSIAVPAGTHNVEFRYKPLGF